MKPKICGRDCGFEWSCCLWSHRSGSEGSPDALGKWDGPPVLFFSLSLSLSVTLKDGQSESGGGGWPAGRRAQERTFAERRRDRRAFWRTDSSEGPKRRGVRVCEQCSTVNRCERGAETLRCGRRQIGAVRMQKSPVEDANFLSRFLFWWGVFSRIFVSVCLCVVLCEDDMMLILLLMKQLMLEYIKGARTSWKSSADSLTHSLKCSRWMDSRVRFALWW